MDGVLNVYKEKGMTSFDVIRKLRFILKIKKIGHTGTLDPDATGVLPVCIGKATKIVDYLIDTDKEYHAEMLLGKKTDTQDISGKVLDEISKEDILKILRCKNDKEIIKNRFLDAASCFQGTIKQIPPMYSAIKINGVKLVDAARRGEEIERKPKEITIYSIDNVEISDEIINISFDVKCSKGTYIRTLCEDIGKKMDIPACLLSLERTGAAGLDVSESIKIEKIDELYRLGELEKVLLPIDNFFSYYPKLIVNEKGKKKVSCGGFLDKSDLISPYDDKKIFRIYDLDNEFYALYKADDKRKCLVPGRMFV